MAPSPSAWGRDSGRGELGAGTQSSSVAQLWAPRGWWGRNADGSSCGLDWPSPDSAPHRERSCSRNVGELVCRQWLDGHGRKSLSAVLSDQVSIPQRHRCTPPSSSSNTDDCSPLCLSGISITTSCWNSQGPFGRWADCRSCEISYLFFFRRVLCWKVTYQTLPMLALGRALSSSPSFLSSHYKHSTSSPRNHPS